MRSYDLLLYAAIILLPAVPAALAYMMFTSNRSRTTGKIGTLEIAAAGPLAAYIFLLFLTIKQIAPHVMGETNALNVAGPWNINVSLRGPIRSLEGELAIFQNKSSLSFAGALAGNTFSSRIGELVDRRAIFLANLNIGGNDTWAMLDASIPVTSPREIAGSYFSENDSGRFIIKKQDLPWILIAAFVLLMPIGPAFFLWWIDLENKIRVHLTLLGLRLNASGPIAGYVAVLVLAFSFYDHILPSAAFAITPKEEATAFNIAGEWCLTNRIAERIESRAQALIRQNGTRLKITGDVEDRQRDGSFSSPVSWSSPVGELNADGRVVFYFQVATRADRGVEFGHLRSIKPDRFSLNWYDMAPSPGKDTGTTDFRRKADNGECFQ